VPNVVTYSALISACEKDNQPRKALEFFKTMQQQGVVSTVITYNALISACEKGDEFEHALEVFETMK